MSGYKVAIAGATGNDGREMLSILAERRFSVSEVVALASSRSIGKEVSFGDKTLKCKALDHYDFADTDICLMSAGGAISKEWSRAVLGQPGLDSHTDQRDPPGTGPLLGQFELLVAQLDAGVGVGIIGVRMR